MKKFLSFLSAFVLALTLVGCSASSQGGMKSCDGAKCSVAKEYKCPNGKCDMMKKESCTCQKGDRCTCGKTCGCTKKFEMKKGSCGAGKCGANMKKGSCGQGKCGSTMKKGSCGAGKCGK